MKKNSRLLTIVLSLMAEKRCLEIFRHLCSWQIRLSNVNIRNRNNPHIHINSHKTMIDSDMFVFMLQTQCDKCPKSG